MSNNSSISIEISAPQQGDGFITKHYLANQVLPRADRKCFLLVH